MTFRRFIREAAFKLARRDVALFLEDHQEELIAIFREELQRLDDELPEEKVFVDLKLVALGETILLATLGAMLRFLREDSSPGTTVALARETEILEEATSNPGIASE
jgi:hypothetical protein